MRPKRDFFVMTRFHWGLNRFRKRREQGGTRFARIQAGLPGNLGLEQAA
jgi:hypothetical protein